MRGQYSTKQREAITEFLRTTSDHISASEIITHLEEMNISVGSATVYRTLDKLEKDGVVRKMSVGDGRGACYQYISHSECHQHFHLKCLGCGKLIHLDCEFLEDMERHILNHHNFTISSGKTVIYGKCEDCKNN